jgi:hypothetical protein
MRRPSRGLVRNVLEVAAVNIFIVSSLSSFAGLLSIKSDHYSAIILIGTYSYLPHAKARNYQPSAPFLFLCSVYP